MYLRTLYIEPLTVPNIYSDNCNYNIRSAIQLATAAPGYYITSGSFFFGLAWEERGWVWPESRVRGLMNVSVGLYISSSCRIPQEGRMLDHHRDLTVVFGLHSQSADILKILVVDGQVGMPNFINHWRWSKAP